MRQFLLRQAAAAGGSAGKEKFASGEKDPEKNVAKTQTICYNGHTDEDISLFGVSDRMRGGTACNTGEHISRWI